MAERSNRFHANRGRRRRLGLVWLALLLLAGPALASEPVELRLWNIPPKSTTDPVYKARRIVFDAFCRSHPEIRVKVVVPLRVQGPAQEGSEFLAVAGGVAPDIFELNGRKIGDYADQGFLLPLNPFLDSDARGTGEAYFGVGAPDCIWDICIRGDRVLAVPYLWYAFQLNFRSDLFSAAGMDPRRSPQDWDELFQYAMRLTRLPDHEPDMDPDAMPVYGIRLLSGTFAGWRFLQFALSSGSDIVQTYLRLPGRLNSNPVSAADADLWPVPMVPTDYSALHIAVLNPETSAAKAEGAKAEAAKLGLFSPADGSFKYRNDDLSWRLMTHSPEGVAALEFQRRLMQQLWFRCDNRAWHEEANRRDRGKFPEYEGWRQPHPREFILTSEVLAGGEAICPECGRRFDLADRAIARRVYRGVAYIDGQTSGLWPRPYAMGLYSLEEVNSNGSSDVSESSEVPPGVLVQHPFPPRKKGMPLATFLGARCLAVNAAIERSSDPGRGDVEAIRQAAWTYIRYVTGREGERIRVKSYVESGLSPFVRPDLLKRQGYDDLYSEIPQRQREMFQRAISTGQVEPYCPGFQVVMTRDLNMPIQEVINDPGMEKDCAALMRAVSDRVNARVLGGRKSEPARRDHTGQRTVAAAVVAFAAMSLVAVRHLVRIPRRAAGTPGQRSGRGGRPSALSSSRASLRRHVSAWLFLSVPVASLLLWQYYPLVRGALMAFQDYKILQGHHSRWVGLSNFAILLSQSDFYRYLAQTLWYVALSIILGLLAPLALAVFLTEIPKGKLLLRTVYYLPAVTSSLVTLFLWKELLFNPTDQGIINQLIAEINAWPLWLAVATKVLVVLAWLALLSLTLGLTVRKSIDDWRQRIAWGLPALLLVAGTLFLLLRPGGTGDARAGGAGLFEGAVAFFRTPWSIAPQGFLRDPSMAMICVIIPTIWAGAGPGCLIYLAALKMIPDEQYEAADLDGAGLWDKVIHVLVPNLRALILTNLVGAFIGAFQAADNIFVMTGGGPMDRTETLGLHIWLQSFLYLNFGYATAAAWVLGAMIIGFTLYQLRILKQVEFKASAQGRP